ncbi:MAG: amylo-alpha-1,6-glucosidase [Desulfobacteraceae bacterium]|nr:MAG: amylo-alpha-1,6-glucosidase [Desulfobacteraceae bacterium]
MVEDLIVVQGRYYIRAHSSLADVQSRVLKFGDTFALFDRHGDIRPLGFEDHGLFHRGTRFLSRHLINLNGQSLLLLSSSVKEDNDFLLVDLTNPDFQVKEGRPVKRGTIYLRRSIFVWRGHCFEKIQAINYGADEISFSIGFHFEADFVDLFEVRGTSREKRGTLFAPRNEASSILFEYVGLDDNRRSTGIEFSIRPSFLQGGDAEVHLSLAPGEESSFQVKIACIAGDDIFEAETYEGAFERVRKIHHGIKGGCCRIVTSNAQFNDWLNRSGEDLYMMLTQSEEGLYPYAGIPWFSTVFGRDGIITALQTLWFFPDIARGVLSYLGARQARTLSEEADAAPGKILHELRHGEMANLKEIPFGQYYGTVDATPLYLILAGSYYRRTGDLQFIRSWWPQICLALEWIDRYGDQDGDGFVEYGRRSGKGLVNQGWKDSEDSIFHADGAQAEAPIALAEVQAYVYEARRMAAQLGSALGYKEMAAEQEGRADSLREAFEREFWCEELQTYAIALDGNKRPCRVRSSNAGHCLFSRIAGRERARILSDGLLGPSFFSGWGIRTLAEGEPRYNPMSYHNGSVWPHDNSVIAYGISRYGIKKPVLRIFKGLFEAASRLELSRMPELFCGFPRQPGEGPVLYPVACTPQSWATASVYLLIQASLGMSIQAPEGRIYFDHPVLPDFLDEMVIEGLRVNSSSFDIRLERHERDVGIDVFKKEGDIEVVAVY